MRRWGPGFVFEWSGAIVDIPETYQLCDGTNGTPDLRNNFIIGAGSTYAVGDIGGEIANPHDFTSAVHFHEIDSGPDLNIASDFSIETTSDPATGTTDGASDLPLFYGLAYIMQTG